MNIIRNLFEKKIRLYYFFILILLFLALVPLLSFGVGHSVLNGASGKFKNLEKFFLELSKIVPNTLEFFNDHQDFKYKLKLKNEIVITNNDKSNDYMLIPRYDLDKGRSLIDLVYIKEKKIIHTWTHDVDKINKLSKLDKSQVNLKRDHGLSRYMYRDPLLLEDGSVIVHGHTPLLRIDKCNNVKWVIDKLFHHSIELSDDNFIWTGTREIPGNYKFLHEDYWDDKIAKLDLNGKLLYEKSVTDIFYENNMEHYITSSYIGFDPIHLNDVQPVNFSSEYWEKGDVFLSLRHLSMLVLYRPSTNKVIWYKQGNWRYQHDIDVLNNKEISFFDNQNKLSADPGELSFVKIYNFENDSIENRYLKLSQKENILSEASGNHEIINDNTVIIEETTGGRIISGEIDGTINWIYSSQGYINLSKYIKPNLANSVLKNLNNNKCND